MGITSISSGAHRYRGEKSSLERKIQKSGEVNRNSPAYPEQGEEIVSKKPNSTEGV